MSSAHDAVQLQDAVFDEARRRNLRQVCCHLYQLQHVYLYGKSGDGLGQMLLQPRHPSATAKTGR